MISYNPKDAVRLIPAGTYDATLTNSVDGFSKAGDQMTTIHFDIHGPDFKATIKEYFTAASTWKLAQLAEALDAKAAFDSGEFDTMKYTGYNLRVDLAVEKGKNGFPDSNRIKKFLPRGENQPVDDLSF